MNRKTKHLLVGVTAFGLVGWDTLLAQPVISVQPRSQTNVVGSNLTLAVEATGTQPLSYQWRRTGVTVAGGTNATLVFTNLQSSHAGNYTVVITNAEGAVTSVLARLVVLVPPTITTQPTSQSVEVGAPVTFLVAVAGTAPFRFQWQFNDADQPGKTNSTLALPNTQFTNAGGYSVIVMNAAGAVTSHVATLTVFPPIFTKIISGEIVSGSANSYSCAWGDYDNDGQIDLFVPNFFGQNNFLYRNNGNGTFLKVTNSVRGTIANDGGASRAGVWGDYDNDGYLDLFVSNANQTNFLYRNNGDGTFARRLNSQHPAVALGNCYGAAWGDYDNDGFLDLFVANFNQDNFLYRNNGGRQIHPNYE